ADPARHPLGEEQTDDLAGSRTQLLADDHATRQPVGELDGAGDRVVVGDAQHVDARLDDRCRQFVGHRGRVAAPHRGAVQVDAHVPGGHRRGEMRMTADRPLGGNARPGGNGRHGTRPQAPDIVTSLITRLIPAARIRSQSRSPPTSTMSSSMRWSVDAMVNSRTGAPTTPLVMSRPAAPVEKSPLIGLTPECSPCICCTSRPSSMSAISSSWVRVPGTSERARQPTPGVPANPPRVALPVDTVDARRAEYELCTNWRSTPSSISTLRRAARPSPSTSVAV